MQNLNLSPEEAIELQKKLITQTKLSPIPNTIKYIAGTDIAYDKHSDRIFTGIVVLDYENMEIVTQSTLVDKVPFPYIPGLLSFREIPSLFKAWEQLEIKPDVVVMDGHGIAHPRRFGVATHFGILTKTPTMGIGKKILCGDFQEVEAPKGSFSEIIHNEEKIGYAFRAADGIKPVFISPGHLCSFEDCLNIANQASRGYRIPEPTRQADILVNKLRREF